MSDKHQRPEAPPGKPIQEIPDDLRREFDSLYARMQTLRQQAAADLLFHASAEELQAIVQLPDPGPPGSVLTGWGRGLVKRHLEGYATVFGGSTLGAVVAEEQVQCGH